MLLSRHLFKLGCGILVAFVFAAGARAQQGQVSFRPNGIPRTHAPQLAVNNGTIFPFQAPGGNGSVPQVMASSGVNVGYGGYGQGGLGQAGFGGGYGQGAFGGGFGQGSFAGAGYGAGSYGYGGQSSLSGGSFFGGVPNVAGFGGGYGGGYRGGYGGGYGGSYGGGYGLPGQGVLSNIP